MNELAINLMRMRKLNGLTQQDVADAAGISRIAYRNLEKGDANPREKTLAALAKALHAPVMDLLAEVPELHSLRYRANNDMSEQERAQGDQVVLRTANWLADFNELEAMLNGKQECSLKSVPQGCSPVDAAAMVRRELLQGNASCCVPDLCGLLERAGIKLFLFDFNIQQLFGISLGQADGGPAIAVNTNKKISVERQIFSIAHELGHLVLHQDSYGDLWDAPPTEPQEREADAFAAAFLMPEQAFLDEWNANRGLHWVDAVLKTKRRFKVSYQVVLRELIELGRAEHPTVYKKFRADYETRYGKKLHWKEELPYLPVRPTEEPRHLDPLDLMEDRLSLLVRDALTAELITVSRAAEILGIPISEMRERTHSWQVIS